MIDSPFCLSPPGNDFLSSNLSLSVQCLCFSKGTERCFSLTHIVRFTWALSKRCEIFCMFDDCKSLCANNIDVSCKRKRALNVFICFSQKTHSESRINMSFFFSRRHQTTCLIYCCSFGAKNKNPGFKPIKFCSEGFSLMT